MKSFRQLFRQPIKLIAGLVLMTMAAAVVCICVGQALAARNTAKELDKQFTTVALPKGEGGFDENGYVRKEIQLPAKLPEWLEEVAQSNPEIVKTVANHGLLSASIPELTPLNYTHGPFISEHYSEGNRRFYRYDPETDGRPYSSAMFVITLDEVPEAVELFVDNRFTLDQARSAKNFGTQQLFLDWAVELGDNIRSAGYTVTLSGTITEVVSLQEGFRDPTGMTARLELSFPTLGNYEALNLEAGQSYLVYGMDYYDEDWALRGHLADKRGNNIVIDEFDPRSLHYYITEEELNSPTLPNTATVARYTVTIKSAQDSDDGKPEIIALELTAAEVNQINAVSMTLWKNFRYISVEPEDRTYWSSYVDRRNNVTYKDHNGEEHIISWEEFTKRYKIPNITRLNGSVEEFLQSEEGKPWREALERDKVNHHAFAVLGSDKAMHLGWFAQQEAKITQGRDITDTEAANGAKVCIIHEQVALANGLALGNTVTLNLYRGDNCLPFQGLRDNSGDPLMPSADFYFTTTPIQETAEYTIVGLWNGPDLWPDISLNEFSLSPNTVIVPKSSVQTEWEHPDSILYNATILHNGKIQDFQTLSRQAGLYPGLTFFDQGYTELVGNFHEFEQLAQQVLIVGSVVYTVILLLFLLLYPGFQGKTAAIMQSLGASAGKRFAHVMLSTMAIIAPATILGGGLGLALWQTVTDALKTSADTTVALQLPTNGLLLIALAQFLLAMLLTAIIAAWIARPRGMSKRTRK